MMGHSDETDLSEPILDEAEMGKVSGTEPEKLGKEAAEVLLIFFRRPEEVLDWEQREQFLVGKYGKMQYILL